VRFFPWPKLNTDKLKVPRRLNRNIKNGLDLGDPADIGAMLIGYMCERIGIENLENKNVLDTGCGVRFTQAIINKDLPVGSYTGVEVVKKIISFLKNNVSDRRFSFHYADVSNQLYNKKGKALAAAMPQALLETRYDIICMFSVITHQQPKEADAIFAFARGQICDDGSLFFSAFIHDEDIDYQELTPKRPGHKSSYSITYLTQILSDNGWEFVSVEDPLPNGLPITTSLLCKPAS
jgi:predicted TPR repeat methyltransferase